MSSNLTQVVGICSESKDCSMSMVLTTARYRPENTAIRFCVTCHSLRPFRSVKTVQEEGTDYKTDPRYT